jgi:hypothetical protein
MGKNWKDVEKGITDWLNEQGIWEAERRSTQGLGTEIEDISWGPISVEVKTRQSFPAYLHLFVKQSEKNSDGKIPIVVMHQNMKRRHDDYVVMRMETLIRLLKALTE